MIILLFFLMKTRLLLLAVVAITAVLSSNIVYASHTVAIDGSYHIQIYAMTLIALRE
jgi:hypothetical protein